MWTRLITAIVLVMVAYNVHSSGGQDVIYYGDDDFSASYDRWNYKSMLAATTSSIDGSFSLNGGPIVRGNGVIRYSLSFLPGFYLSDEEKGLSFVFKSKLYMTPIYSLEIDYRATNPVGDRGVLINIDNQYRIGVVVDWFSQDFDSSFGYWENSNANGVYIGVKI